MKIIKIEFHWQIPKNFTGIVEWQDNKDHTYCKDHYSNGRLCKLNGPARIYLNSDRPSEYWINSQHILNTLDKDHEQIFYNSKEYKQAILLENMKRIKNIFIKAPRSRFKTG